MSKYLIRKAIFLKYPSFKIVFIALMYELEEDFFLRSDDLAKKYVDNIISVLDNTKPGNLKN